VPSAIDAAPSSTGSRLTPSPPLGAPWAGTATAQRHFGAWRDYTLALCLILAAGAVAHGHGVYVNFHRHHWEDWRFFRHTRVQIETPLDCFTQPEPWPGLYRPLSTNGYYLLARPVFGTRVEGYHIVNAALFVCNALLLFAIARRLLPRPWAFVPPILFVSRLSHVQVLLYTSEIQALLSSFFALLSILWFVCEPAAGELSGVLLSLGALTLGLLSKESVVVVPAIVSAQAWLCGRRPDVRRLLALWAVAAAWAVLFAVALRRVSGNEPTGYAYDFSWAIGGRYVAYVLSFFNVLARPIDSTDMPSRIVSLAARPWVVVAVTLVAAAGIWVTARSRSRVAEGDVRPGTVAFGLWWFVLGMSPFVIFADRLFMRYAYFGHAGLAIAVAGAGWLAVGPRGVAIEGPEEC
jgi:hypothetical protein